MRKIEKNAVMRAVRRESREVRTIVEMLLEAFERGRIIRSRIGDLVKVSLQIIGGRRNPRASLRVVRCREDGRTCGTSRTIVVPIIDVRDPQTVAATLAREAFLAHRERLGTLSQRREFHRPYSAQRSH